MHNKYIQGGFALLLLSVMTLLGVYLKVYTSQVAIVVFLIVSVAGYLVAWWLQKQNY